mgnify:CR=1 FL=1|jgi:LysM repeat protein
MRRPLRGSGGGPPSAAVAVTGAVDTPRAYEKRRSTCRGLNRIRYGHVMKLAGKVTTGIAVLVVGGLVVLAAPAVAAVHGELSSWRVFAPAGEEEPEVASADDPLGEKMIDELGDGYVYVGGGTAIPKDSPAGCDEPAWIHLGAMSASLSGNLIDRGSSDFAAGTVGLGEEGQILTYTVAAGDALYSIGDRFCIANALTIATLNHTRTIQPGEVLLLAPDSSIPWIPYFNPADAPAGYQQIPYQLAIEAMSSAAQAGDVGAMREIFEGELSALFPNPADADLIANALETGDLKVLRQMFA